MCSINIIIAHNSNPLQRNKISSTKHRYFSITQAAGPSRNHKISSNIAPNMKPYPPKPQLFTVYQKWSAAPIAWCNRPFLYFLHNIISSSFMNLVATYPKAAPTSLSKNADVIMAFYLLCIPSNITTVFSNNLSCVHQHVQE